MKMCGPVDYSAAALSISRIGLVFAVLGIVLLWSVGYHLIRKFRYSIPAFASSLMHKPYENL